MREVEIEHISNLKVGSISGKHVKASIDMGIRNENSFPITVTRTDLGVTVAGVKISDIKLSKHVRVPAKSTETYTIDFEGDIGNALLGGIGGVLSFLGKGTINVEIEGEVKARSWFISKTFPVQHKEAVNIKG